MGSSIVSRTRFAAMMLTGALGCGGGHHPGEGVVGRSQPSARARAIELDLLTPDGEYVDLVEFRGGPVLLFLFATWDTTSQAALVPLRRLVRDLPNVQVIGIAVQPDARVLLDAYVHALEPPFLVAYEPEARIAQGLSPLGDVTVPMFIVLDREGREVDRYNGFRSERELARILEDQ